MEINNFTIEILISGEQLNLLFFYKNSIETLSIIERVQVFTESFLSMQGDTVGALSGSGRRSCNTWNSIVFAVNFDNTLLSSNQFTRVAMEGEMSMIPQTVGQFIESKYQDLITNTL